MTASDAEGSVTRIISEPSARQLLGLGATSSDQVLEQHPDAEQKAIQAHAEMPFHGAETPERVGAVGDGERAPRQDVERGSVQDRAIGAAG